MSEVEPVVGLEPGEALVFLDRPAPPRPVIVKVVLVVLMGPGAMGALLGAPLAGWLTKSWWVAALFVASAVVVAGLGWATAKLTTSLLEARVVHVQVTTKRCVTARQQRVESMAWSEVAAIRALRQPGADSVGEVSWLDVAGLLVELAVDAHAESKAPTSQAYWLGAAGFVLRGKDGRVMPVPCAKVASVGPELVRALAEGRAPALSASTE